jgi:hypothetical protein
MAAAVAVVARRVDIEPPLFVAEWERTGDTRLRQPAMALARLESPAATAFSTAPNRAGPQTKAPTSKASYTESCLPIART